MRIVTHYWPKPIPSNQCDWSAVDDDTYDGSGPVGYGPTEEAAIADLMQYFDEEPEESRT